MNYQKFKELLKEPDTFKAWLVSQPKNKIAGELGVCSHCPVANFLKPYFNEEEEVIVSSSTVSVPKRGENYCLRNPDWLSIFVLAVDSIEDFSGVIQPPVTVGRCIEILDGIIKARSLIA